MEPLPRDAAAWVRLAWYANLSAAVALAAATRWTARGRPLAELFEADLETLAQLDVPPRRVAGLSATPEPPPELLDALEAARIGLLPVTAPDYPAVVHRAVGYRPPPLLSWQGRLDLLRRPAAAIVGNRDASDAALAYAFQLAGWLARAKVNVVSGNARGIDRAAHAGAFERGGPTTAVLPEGLLHWEGNRHVDLALSSYHPLAPVSPRRALARNGLVGALAGCLVVAEARPIGGTWNAANQALRQGRPVLVRPDRPTSGGAALLRLGALPLPAEPLEASEVVMRQLALTTPPREDEPELPGLFEES